MKRKIIIAVALAVLVVGALGGIKAMQFRKMIEAGKSFAPPPETISSSLVKQEQWQSTLIAIGSVTAFQGINVTPDLPGAVREIAFESGAVVQPGDLLVKLDVSAEEAQLRSVEAQVNLARLNLERVRTLRGQNMVAQAELDVAEATLKQHEATADSIRATIEKKTIRAPFAGKLGIRLVDLGEYLETGTPVVSLQALTPIYAEFSLPQQDLSKLKTGMKVRVTTDAYAGQNFEGTLTTINPDLDRATRSVRLQATLQNEDQRLRPGMFARVEVLLPDLRDVLVIPATSVLSQPYGDSVYIIEPNPTNNAALQARQQFVRTGPLRGDYVAIETGLKEGQKVASAGHFKLRNGLTVVENNNVVPPASTTPRPPDS
jgi:membrane fusion protein (multidrug efflux system)